MIALVGLVGIVQWNQQTIQIGFVAGLAVIVVNAVAAAVREWHLRNTAPGATYVDAEELVRLQRKSR